MKKIKKIKRSIKVLKDTLKFQIMGTQKYREIEKENRRLLAGRVVALEESREKFEEMAKENRRLTAGRVVALEEYVRKLKEKDNGME